MTEPATASLPAPRRAENDAGTTLSPKLALGLLALWLLLTIGLRPLLVPDEGRYGSVARDMLASGDWIVPRLDGLPFFHKPPLMYWLDAAAMAVFGVNPFAARIAPAIGAWVMGAALFLAMRRWHGPRVAQTGLLVLASAPFFFLSGQYVNHDMLVAGLISVAVLAFAQAAEGEQGSRRAWQLGWIACALALLSKGLIGFVLPLMIVGPWVLAQRRWRAVGQALHPWSWLPGLIIAAPWFVAMQWRFPEFFDYFVIEQHFRRFTQTGFNNGQPFWFYWVVLPLTTVPWFLAAPRALRRAWLERDRWIGLYAWWALVVLLFFSMPNSKLVGYVLPALAPWCALIACRMDLSWRWQRAGAFVGAVISLAVIVVLVVRTPHSTRDAAQLLASRLQPGDSVVYMEEMYYDFAFYARAPTPVKVLSDWADPAIAQHDNWRKELADAARFDPAMAQQVLWPIGRLDALLCTPGHSVWFVSGKDYANPALERLPGLQTVHRDALVKLQLAPGRACP